MHKTHARTHGKQISIYVDVKADDSYTPNRISIRAGTYFGDLQEVLPLYPFDYCFEISLITILVPMTDQAGRAGRA
jgi:hypothetical protein